MARIMIGVIHDGGYEDGMISLGDRLHSDLVRVFPMPIPARAIILQIGKGSVCLDRAEALEVAAAIRSVAHDG